MKVLNVPNVLRLAAVCLLAAAPTLAQTPASDPSARTGDA